MKLKITSLKQLSDGHLSFNLVMQPTDSCQLLIPSMRVMFGKVYPPSCKKGGTHFPAVYVDQNTAMAIYEELVSLETPPVLLPWEEAIKPMLITQKQIDKYVVLKRDEELDIVVDEA